MKERICGLLYFLLLGLVAGSQGLHIRTHAAGFHAGVYDKDFINAFSFAENQALLASSRHLVAGIYSERKYGVAELQFINATVTVPFPAGGIGFQLQYFGYSAYNECNLGISYGRKLGKWVDIGIQFNYHLLHASGYGSAYAVNGELGIIFHLSENLHAGISIYNPGGTRWSGASGEKLGASFKTGIGYVITNEFYLHLDLVKDEDQQADIQAAIRCQFANRFFGSLGIEANEFSPFGSAGWGWKKMRIYIAVSHHPQLGFTPGVSLQFGNFCLKNSKS